MVGSHALAMGPAPSVHVCLRGSAAIAFYFLFDPPSGWSQTPAAPLHVRMLVTVRVLLSLYEIPSSALGPELTLDYDQRTSLNEFAILFRNPGRRRDVGARPPGFFYARTRPIRLACSQPAGYRENSAGREHRDFFSIMISCIGTHRFIASLVHSPKSSKSPGRRSSESSAGRLPIDRFWR